MLIKQLSYINSSYLQILSIKIVSLITYQKKGLFKSNPQSVFNIIKSTQRYSKFIPWCSRSLIINKINNNQNKTQLTIRFNNIKQLSYLSHVKIYEFQQQQFNLRSQQQQNHKQFYQFYRIQSICKDNPLKRLISIWDIYKQPVTQQQQIYTKVNYYIQYQFSSPFLQLTSHLFLNYVGQAMWDIFKKQCEKQIIINNSQVENQQQMTKFENKKDKQIKILSQQKQKQQPKQQQQQISLQQFLNKHQTIKNQYNKNEKFKNMVDSWNILIKGTNKYEQKILFKINNYLLYHPLSQ